MKRSPSLNKRNNDDVQTIFIYIVEDQVMFVNAQRNKVHIQQMPFLSLIQNVKN
jgi:hypothetical protein